MDDWQMAPSNNIALIIVIVLVVIGVIILLVVLFNSSKSTPPNNNSTNSSNKDDDNDGASDSGGAPTNPKSTKGSKNTSNAAPKVNSAKVSIGSKTDPVVPEQVIVHKSPQLPIPSSHIEHTSVPVNTISTTAPVAVVPQRVTPPEAVLPTVVSQPVVVAHADVPHVATAYQVVPSSAFDNSSSEPFISGGDVSIIISSEMDSDGFKQSSSETNEPSTQPDSSDLLISGSDSKDLSISSFTFSESEQLDIEELAREEVLASVEEISLPSSLGSSDEGNSPIEIPRLPVAPRTKLYVPVMTDLSATRTSKNTSSTKPLEGSGVGSAYTSNEINFSNANETAGLSVDQSISDPASFSSDFSSQTDKSSRPNQRKVRVNPLNELVNLGRGKKNNPRMGPFQ